jgi:Flp pilus assembly protein TadG
VKSAQKLTNPSPGKSHRSGATLVESAITLPLLLLIIFGVIDLGLAVHRAALCHEMARIGARMVIVHGADARRNGVWSASQATAAIHDQIDPILQAAAVDPANVQVSVTWQKAGSGPYPNSPGSYVTVQVSLISVSHIPFLRLSPLNISSDSRMVISN